MARKPSAEPLEEKTWTPESIRSAVRKIRRRLTDVEAFDPQTVTHRLDPRVNGLETSVRATLGDVFGENSHSYRNYQSAAALDTAGIYQNNPPLPKGIAGLEDGKKRSITLLNGAIRFLEEKLADDFPGEPPVDEVLPQGKATTASAPIGLQGVEARGSAAGEITAGPTPAAHSLPQAIVDSLAVANFPISINGRLEFLDSREARFETLLARVAVLELAISTPKPVAEFPIGPGHNRGPDLVLDGSVEEEEIRRFIALLKQQNVSAPIDVPQLNKFAESISSENNKWRERLDELAKGVLKGAGEEVGKRLIQAPWWIAVYSQLEAVGKALVAWLSTFPPA
jgi:hypothetical protein